MSSVLAKLTKSMSKTSASLNTTNVTKQILYHFLQVCYVTSKVNFIWTSGDRPQVIPVDVEEYFAQRAGYSVNVNPYRHHLLTLGLNKTPKIKLTEAYSEPKVCSYSGGKRKTSKFESNTGPTMEGSEKDDLKLCDRLPEHLSFHAAHIHEVHNVPMKVLIRPFPSVLEEKKVLSLMETIENPETIDRVPPIDILWITGREGGDYYYSFGGCHRYEAYKRLKRESIPCKVFRSTITDLQSYLGGSTPDLL